MSCPGHERPNPKPLLQVRSCLNLIVPLLSAHQLKWSVPAALLTPTFVSTLQLTRLCFSSRVLTCFIFIASIVDILVVANTSRHTYRTPYRIHFLKYTRGLPSTDSGVSLAQPYSST